MCKRWRDILNTKEIWKGCEAKLHLQRLTSALVMPSLKSRGVKRIQGRKEAASFLGRFKDRN